MPSFFRAGEAESERFRFLCEDYALGEPEGGVGVLREKGIHAVLKRYYQPEAAAREVRVGRFVADAVSPDGSVLEVQTGRLAPLRRKLPALLDRYEVTVVHPLLRVRRVRAVDPQTGELSARRVCGKPETVWNFFYELPPLLPFLQRPNLHFVLPVIETEELRVKGSRRGARVDRLPSALCGEYRFRNAQDFLSLLPAGCPPPSPPATWRRPPPLRRRMPAWRSMCCTPCSFACAAAAAAAATFIRYKTARKHPGKEI